MNRLIYTVGLQASGKSTWAKQEALRPDHVQVELDEIRIELGMTTWSPELEREAQAIRDRRILDALRAGKTVICSDTNLKPKVQKHLEGLAAKVGVPAVRKNFLDVPLEVCIERDRVRGEQGGVSVGEAVIRRTYAHVRPNDEVLDTRQHFVIGDVHGDLEKLLALLRRVGVESHGDYWVNRGGLHIVFLGDLNDPRKDTEEENLAMSSFGCIEVAKQLVESGAATCVRSNHQKDLIRLWQGHDINLRYGLDFTKAEMLALKESRGKQYVDGLMNWLDSLPYFYSFIEQKQLYTCVHAYYTEGMKQYAPEDKDGLNAVYGVKTPQNTRLEWWRERDRPTDRTVIAGHYHEVVFPKENGAILLDGGCGTSHGRLVGLLVGENRLLEV